MGKSVEAFRFLLLTPSKVLRVTVLGLLLLSLFVIAMITFQTQELIVIRSGMDNIWSGQTGINQWGIGQIGAPFAWAPLIADISCSGFERLRSWCKSKRSKTSQREQCNSNPTVSPGLLQILEDGKLEEVKREEACRMIEDLNNVK